MIIDTHVHISDTLFYMSEEYVLESMNKYGIDFSLVSNADAAEVDHDQNLLPSQIGQIEASLRSLRFARENPSKIGALLWVKPLTEEYTQEFEDLLVQNLDIIYGIKVHPFHSKISFGSKEVEKYIQLARKYSLPVVIHTASDYESSPRIVYEVALEYPDVNFVMVHMGLGTDNEEAIDLISKLPNLYGDTTWVSLEKTRKAIKTCGIDKILFGSDNPIDGLDTYKSYLTYFNDLKDFISTEDYEKLMYKNAIKVFNLKNL